MSRPGSAAGRVALACAGVLALAGCQSSLETAVTVTGPGQANVHVRATFTDEAAKSIQANPATRAALEAVFTQRTGQPPTYHGDDQLVTVDSDVTYEQLRDSGAVLGVSGLNMGTSGSDVVVSMALSPPTGLVAAVTTASAGQPDAGPLSTTMLKSTLVSLAVTFPGGVHQVSGNATRMDEGLFRPGTAIFERNASDTSTQTVSVTGSPDPSRAPWLAGGAAAAAGALLLWRRRR